MVEETVKWPLLTGANLTTWLAPGARLIVIGDAAHAMVPYMSQGAAMAIEDGAALAEVLSYIQDKKDIGQALHVFEYERKQRAGGMQSASLVNGKLWHFGDGPQQKARDLGMRAELENRATLQSTNQWSDPVTEHWAYGYNAESAVKESWERIQAYQKFMANPESQFEIEINFCWIETNADTV
jgi:salicylate hydroxylase